MGLFLLTVVLLTLCGIADSILRSSWSRFYYLRGVTYFTHEFDYPYPFNIKRIDLLMKRENPDGKYKSDMIFNVLANNAIAFYERPGKAGWGIKKRSYFAVLHGVMVFKERKLTIAGIFDYLALIFIPALMIFVTAYAIRFFKEGLPVNGAVLGVLLLLFVYGFISALVKQKKRFTEIGNIMIEIGRKEKR